MDILDLIKKKYLWIVVIPIFFYVMLIFVSDAEKISKHFLQIRIDFLFLIFSLVFLSHVIKSFRQKEFLQSLDEKIPTIQNLIVYMAGLSLINTPGGVGTFVKSVYLRKKFKIPTEKSISVIFLERYHDLLAGTSIILVTLLISFSLVSASLIVISTIILVGVYLLIRKWNASVIVYNKISKIKFLSQYMPESVSSESLSILTGPKNMTKGWLLSVLGWIVDSLAVYTVFLALNVDLDYHIISQIYFTSIGYGVLSFLPGGIGVTESIADVLLLQQGLELFVASSLVIVMRLSTVWFSTLIGVVFTRFAIKQNLQD